MTDTTLEYIRRLETIVLFNTKFIESLKEQYKTNKIFTKV